MQPSQFTSPVSPADSSLDIQNQLLCCAAITDVPQILEEFICKAEGEQQENFLKNQYKDTFDNKLTLLELAVGHGSSECVGILLYLYYKHKLCDASEINKLLNMLITVTPRDKVLPVFMQLKNYCKIFQLASDRAILKGFLEHLIGRGYYETAAIVIKEIVLPDSSISKDETQLFIDKLLSSVYTSFALKSPEAKASEFLARFADIISLDFQIKDNGRAMGFLHWAAEEGFFQAAYHFSYRLANQSPEVKRKILTLGGKTDTPYISQKNQNNLDAFLLVLASRGMSDDENPGEEASLKASPSTFISDQSRPAATVLKFIKGKVASSIQNAVDDYKTLVALFTKFKTADVTSSAFFNVGSQLSLYVFTAKCAKKKIGNVIC